MQIVYFRDEIYHYEGLFEHPDGHQKRSLAQFVDRLADFPLLFQPGDARNYGFNLELVGRLVEVISGMPIDEFMATKIFKPLKMEDTAFIVDGSKRPRFCKIYMVV